MPNNFDGMDAAVAGVLQQDQGTTALQIRNNLQGAVTQNPDQAAHYQHLAKFVGVPLETVQQEPDLVKQQAFGQQFDADELARLNPQVSRYLTDPNNAAKSHDDLPALTGIEASTKALPAPRNPPPSFTDQVGGFLADNLKSLVSAPGSDSAPLEIMKGLGGSFNKAAGSLNLVLGAVPTVYDKVAGLITGKPQTDASDAWFRRFVDPMMSAQPQFEADRNAPFVAKAFNTTGNLLGMLSQITLSGGGGEAAPAATSVPELLVQSASHATKSMAFPAISDSVSTANRVYQETGDAGAAIRAAQMQYATTTMAGAVPLSAPGGLAARAVGGFVSGVATGETSRQAMNMVLPPSMQQPFDLEGMALSGLSGTMLGAVMGPHAQPSSVHDAIRQTYTEATKASQAEQGAQAIQALGEVAAASKTRERDPEGFKQLVKNMTEDGQLQEVYVAADQLNEVLNQSGVTPAQLVKALPELADQMKEASITNGYIRIPVEDYATHIAGGPVDAALLPHLKVDPDGMTFRESQDYFANQKEAMTAQAEKIIADQQDIEAKQADVQAVQDKVLEQLTNAGRFNADVNKSYAALAREFYATMAERSGMTASELYAKHPLMVTGESLTGGLEQANRASFSPETSTIALLKTADLSSYLHESGHFFLETLHDMASHLDAPEGIKADFDTLLRSFGETGSTPEQRLADWTGKTLDEKRAGHEQFAQSFEKYLMEGKAPSLELQPLFARFRSWLVNVYKTLSGLNVKLSDEVRGVMDRLLASSEAIKEAEQTRKYGLLFDTPEAAGISREAFTEYENLGKQATDQAVTDMTARSMKDMQWASNAKAKAIKSLQKSAASKREAIREEVTKEVDATPLYRVESELKSKGGQKLSIKGLEEMYGGEGDRYALLDWKRLVDQRLAGKDGMHPDMVAELNGFQSGDELVRALLDRQPRDQLIRDLTDQRMLERHGELVDAQSVERAAEAAVHNEARAKFMATGLKILSKSPIPAKQLAAAAKEAAQAAIAAKRVRDIRPGQYSAAEALSNADAIKLAAKDPQGAVQAQRAALLNNRLFKAATNAVAEIQKGLDYLAKFDKPSIRENIDLEYRDQIDALLDRFDLRKSVSNSALDKREALAAFVERMASQGYEPQIPEKLLNELTRQHYKDMSVEEFRGLVDAVKSIEHLGKLKTKLLDGKEAKDLAELANEARDTMAQLPQREAESNRGLTFIERKWLDVKSAGRSMQAALLKMEQMMDWLDNRNSNGVLNRVVFRRIADAGVKENDLQLKIKAELDKLMESHANDVTRDKGIFVADGLIDGATGQPQRFTKKEMLALAGNMGNESNVAKLIKGEGWDEGEVWAFLAKNMTKADWDFVAGLGKTLETLWPEKLEMSRRLGNTNPEKIAPRAFDTPHGRYDGWYWPMVYDPARAHDVAERGAKSGDALFENIYSRANTDTGRMNTRNENYARPLLLSLDVIPRVIKDEIHDIAYREAIIDADKFLSNSTVRESITSALSTEHYDQLRPWLQSIANDRKVDMQALKWFDQVAHGARTRATIVGLGYRLSTMLVHGSSAALESVAEVGPVWFARGLADFANPTQWTANRDFIFERSGEMRNRMNEVDRDVREHLREIDLRLMDTTTGAVARGADLMKAHAYQGIAMLDMASALPTWMAAYHKGMAPESAGGKGLSEQDAVYFADKTVRNAHGGTGIKDQAAVQRGPEFFKLFTMFYTFWNHNVNRLMDTGRMVMDKNTWKDSEKAGTAIMRTLIYTLGIQAMHSMLHPPKDEEGEEGWLKWAGKEFTAAAFAGVPILRDLSAHFLTGKDYSVTPAASMVDAVGKSGIDAANALTGKEVNDKWLKHTITTAGYAFGLPLGQPASTAQFLWDVADGKQNPQQLSDWWHGIQSGEMSHH